MVGMILVRLRPLFRGSLRGLYGPRPGSYQREVDLTSVLQQPQNSVATTCQLQPLPQQQRNAFLLVYVTCDADTWLHSQHRLRVSAFVRGLVRPKQSSLIQLLARDWRVCCWPASRYELRQRRQAGCTIRLAKVHDRKPSRDLARASETRGPAHTMICCWQHAVGPSFHGITQVDKNSGDWS